MKLSPITLWSLVGTLAALRPTAGWAADQPPAKKMLSFVTRCATGPAIATHFGDV